MHELARICFGAARNPDYQPTGAAAADDFPRNVRICRQEIVMEEKQQQRKVLWLLLLLLLTVSLLAFRHDLFQTVQNFIINRRASHYDLQIRKISSRYGLDYRLVKALIRVESKFNKQAVSAKGAMGLMQLMPETAKHFGVADPFDPKENLDGGVRYLKYLLKVFNNNLILALAAYNAGPAAVKRYNGVPPFEETQAYLKKVMECYGNYKG